MTGGNEKKGDKEIAGRADNRKEINAQGFAIVNHKDDVIMSINIHTLNHLRSALVSALHLSIQHGEGQQGQEDTDRIIDVLRQVELTTLLQGTAIYAIAGTQGAGKTTLAKEILGIDDLLLEGNPGRGEQVPLFIEQCADAAAGQPDIIFVCLNRDSGEIDRTCRATPEELKRVLRDWSAVQSFEKDSLRLLYPLIRINQQQSFIDEKITWALLPGYELVNSRNHQWQEMMRHVMVNARGVLFVTDQTQLANDSRTTVLDDLRENFSQRSPVIVVSKTEALNEQEREEVKASAMARFASDPATGRDSVVTTGVGNRESWIDTLRETVKDNLTSSYASEAVALDRFMSLIKGDVGEIIDSLKMLCDTRQQNESVIDDILAEYDKSVAAYETQLRKAIKNQTQQHLIQAVTVCKERYKAEEVGFINNAKILGRRLAFQGLEVDDDRHARVMQAWQAQYDGQDISERNISALTTLNRKTLAKSGLLPDANMPSPQAISLAQKMGYQVQPHQSGTGIVNPGLLDGLQTLLRGKEVSQFEQLSAALKVLPALSLEFGLAEIALRQDPACTIPLADEILPQTIFETLFSGSDNYHPIKTALMAFVGADAADGTLDGKTTTDNPGGAFTPLALVGKAALVASIAYGLYQLTGVIRDSDKAQIYYINQLMSELAFQNEQFIIGHYHEMMDGVRQHIEGNLHRIYGTQDALSNKSTIMLTVKKLVAVQKEARLYEANVQQVLA